MYKALSPFVALVSLSVWAECSNLSGSYQVTDVAKDCKVEQSDGTLMVYASNPAVLLMGKPGPHYGHFLNGLVINGMDQIEITQNGCDSLTAQSLIDPERSLLLEVGHLPYFGARSPVFADVSIDESGVIQNMLISKFTVISNGEQVVYSDLKYNSSLNLDEKGDLIAKATIRYGKKDKKIEAVECKFSRF